MSSSRKSKNKSENHLNFRFRDKRCLKVSRSAPLCNVQPREQNNENTAYIDGTFLLSSNVFDLIVFRLYDLWKLAERFAQVQRRKDRPAEDESIQCTGSLFAWIIIFTTNKFIRTFCHLTSRSVRAEKNAVPHLLQATFEPISSSGCLLFTFCLPENITGKFSNC